MRVSQLGLWAQDERSILKLVQENYAAIHRSFMHLAAKSAAYPQLDLASVRAMLDGGSIVSIDESEVKKLFTTLTQTIETIKTESNDSAKVQPKTSSQDLSNHIEQQMMSNRVDFCLKQTVNSSESLVRYQFLELLVLLSVTLAYDQARPKSPIQIRDLNVTKQLDKLITKIATADERRWRSTTLWTPGITHAVNRELDSLAGLYYRHLDKRS
jgi:hypothetical protein